MAEITPLKLTVFDQSPAVAGQPQGEAIRQSLALAVQAEAWGYQRYWVSEHHNNPSLVGSAPEILATAIAARTFRMRVGVAGVLLPYYSPFKVAEQFRVLEAIAPGRVDLGIGRSPGGQGQAAALAAALRPGAGEPGAHDKAVRQLLHWLYDAPDPPHGVQAFPCGQNAPEVWMLGGSCNGARLAAELGLPFAFNYSNGLLPDGVEAPLDLYRSNYKPSALYPVPKVSLQVWALAASDRDEARRLFMTRAFWRVQLDRGMRAPLISPEAVHAEPLTTAEERVMDAMHERHLIGDVSEVSGRLTDLAKLYDVQEFAVPTWTHAPAARAESYRLLAQALMPETSAAG